MSRRRTAPSLHRVEQAAHDVLAGRMSMSVGELLACIHVINPTGRSLGVADERRRYELKARLQSLLIRRFHDDLVVTADERGVVALRHRYLGQDACHARLDELDEDARARVQWLLDIAEAADPVHAGMAVPASAEADGGMALPSAPEVARRAGALAQGRAALAEFDYEAARAHFERAALASCGDPAAARPLLELLVDQLGLDHEALALEPRLPPEAAADGDVRALLAVAAARARNAAVAERLLPGLAGPRAADAWCALADDAIERQASDELDRCIARLAASDPAHPGLVRLRGELHRLRAEARSPAEQALLRHAEDGDDAAVEAMARELLARWPDSAVAGRLLGRIQAHRRSTEVERLLASARGALADGDVGRATELCRQARAAGADTEAVMEQIRAADAAQRRARDDAEVAAVCGQLAGADPRPGLVAFLALEPDLRRRVRTQLDLPMLAWAEQASVRARGARRGAILDAVLAIAAAGDAIARGDDEPALALLDLHAPLLAGVPRASELRAEAQRTIAARRHAAATGALAQAQHALAGGDLARCERLCDRADPRDLDATQRAQLDQLRHELRAQHALVRRRERIDHLVASGDLVTPRRELAEILAAPPAGPPQVKHAGELHQLLDDLRAELRHAWHVRSEDTGVRRDHPDPVGELLGPLPYVEEIAPWLVAGGRELVIAAVAGPHVFIGHVSVDDRRLLGRRYLRAPEPLGAVVSTTVDGDTVWLVGEAGRVLQVAWTTGEPVRWASLAPFLTAGEQIERVLLLPGGSHLWLEAGVRGEGNLAVRVIEVAPWRVRRELPASRSLHALVAGAVSGVISGGLEGGAVRYTERGAVAEEIAACARTQVSAVTVDPDRDLVVLGARLDGPDEIEILRIKAGRTVHRRSLPGSSVERAHRCASARDPDLLVVHHSVDLDDARLVALRFAGPELAPAYTVDAPSDIVLTQDVDATRVVALWDSARGVELTRLGSEAPAFSDAISGRARWSIPALADYFSCQPEATAAELVSVANRAARRGDWQEVRALLEGIPLDRVAPRSVAHHCHLLGIAWLRTGAEAARAHELWHLAQAHEQADDLYFSCRLGACLELVEPLPDPLPAAWWSPGSSPVRQLRGAIATADQLLAAGAPEAALAVMRRRVVTRASELQSTARLAAAWLAIDPACAGGRFDKAIALARFAALVERRALDLPIEGALHPAQLTALAARAEQWLATWQERL